MADIILTKEDFDHIDAALIKARTQSGGRAVILADKAGQLVSCQGDLEERTAVSLAALSAADYGSATAIANLFGEKEFTVCFRKGVDTNIHFASLGEECILITVFDDSTNLALVREEARKVLEDLQAMFG